jgi:hypothetical protein
MTVDRQLIEIRVLFETALNANLALFDATMKIHGRSQEYRSAALEDVRGREMDRIRVALDEFAAVLIRDGETVQ